MLGAIESLLSAVVADRMTGDRHNRTSSSARRASRNIVSPLSRPAGHRGDRAHGDQRALGARSPVAG